MAIIWGYFFEGVIPDTYDIIDTIIASIGVIIIFYYPVKRWKKLESTHLPIEGPIFVGSSQETEN